MAVEDEIERYGHWGAGAVWLIWCVAI